MKPKKRLTTVGISVAIEAIVLSVRSGLDVEISDEKIDKIVRGVYEDENWQKLLQNIENKVHEYGEK